MLGDFNELFRIISADDETHLKICYQLRYKIFCLEKGLICPSDGCRTEEEQDQYDRWSKHSLLLYLPTNEYVGTVRLISPQFGDEKDQLPIERLAHDKFYPEIMNCQRLPRRKVAEISRLSVLPEFRPKFAVLGLFRAILEHAIKYDIDYLYHAVEPRVHRILERLGIHFEVISPPIDYHGVRQCCFGCIYEMEKTLYLSHPYIWEVLTDNGRLYPDVVDSRKDDDMREDFYLHGC